MIALKTKRKTKKMSNTINKCLNCAKEISQVEGKKARLYCGDSCRIAFKRKANIIDPISEQISISEQTKSEQTISEHSNPNMTEDQKRIGKAIEGYCHGCGRKITEIKGMATGTFLSEEQAKLICLCHECIKQGITHETLDMDISKCDISPIEPISTPRGI